MDKYKKLISNSGLFFIANFGSKVLSFLLVPLYTHVLSTEEYGITDIIITTAMMIVPLVTLSVSEACLRFSMDKDALQNNILSCGLLVTVLGNAVLIVFCPLLVKIQSINQFILLFYLTTLGGSFYVVVSQFCRGYGKIKQYAFGGVLSTFTLVASNLLFLLVFKIGVTGYLLSVSLSYIVPTIYYCFVIRVHRLICIPSKTIVKHMLIYSIPMIPNAFSWWAMQAADKYILVFFYGAVANGLYVVAQKIPTILNLISNLFMQSWQISAVDESESEDKNAFFSSVFEFLSATMLITTSAILIVIKPLYHIWVESSYYDSWKYTPILLLANVFSCFSVFVGTNYMATKKTTGNLKTTIVGCIINIILNVILIPKYGIYAAAFTTLISFMLTWIIRIFDTRGFVNLMYNYKRFLLVVLLICCQYVILLKSSSVVIPALPFIIVVLVYRRDIKALIIKIKEKIKGKNNG